MEAAMNEMFVWLIIFMAHKFTETPLILGQYLWYLCFINDAVNVMELHVTFSSKRKSAKLIPIFQAINVGTISISVESFCKIMVIYIFMRPEE